MPRTWSSRSGPPVASSPRSEATHQSRASAAYGPQVAAGDDAVTLGDDEAQRDGALDTQRRQGGGDLGQVDGVAEREEPDERRARGVRGRGDPLRGQGLLAVEGGGRHRAEQLGDAGDGEAGGDEVGAQGADEVGVDAGRGVGHRGRA